MGRYSFKEKDNLLKNFKVNELEWFIENARQDLSTIAELIAAAEKQIKRVNETDFDTFLVLERGSMRGGAFGVYVLQAPKGLNLEKEDYNFESSFPVTEKYSFNENESCIAVLYCEEMIRKYNIPRQKLFIVGYMPGKHRKKIDSIFDEVYSGKSYIEKCKEYCYKEDIYLDFKAQTNIEKTSDRNTVFLSDGRPCEVQYDGYSDAWYARFIFSSEDIEFYTNEDLIRLLQSELPKHEISKTGLERLMAGIYRDEAGHRIWKVTIELE